jgi:hypothetical protein
VIFNKFFFSKTFFIFVLVEYFLLYISNFVGKFRKIENEFCEISAAKNIGTILQWYDLYYMSSLVKLLELNLAKFQINFVKFRISHNSKDKCRERPK